MLAGFLGWLQANALGLIIGFLTAAAQEYLRNKAIADKGAAQQRAAQEAADAAAAAAAKKVADGVQAQSDADYAATAGSWGA